MMHKEHTVTSLNQVNTSENRFKLKFSSITYYIILLS